MKRRLFLVEFHLTLLLNTIEIKQVELSIMDGFYWLNGLYKRRRLLGMILCLPRFRSL